MTAVAERHDLDGDLGQRGNLDEALQLGAHGLADTHWAPQRRFVHDRRPDFIPGLVGCDAGCLSKAAQLVSQHPQDGGICPSPS